MLASSVQKVDPECIDAEKVWVGSVASASSFTDYDACFLQRQCNSNIPIHSIKVTPTAADGNSGMATIEDGADVVVEGE